MRVKIEKDQEYHGIFGECMSRFFEVFPNDTFRFEFMDILRYCVIEEIIKIRNAPKGEVVALLELAKNKGYFKIVKKEGQKIVVIDFSIFNDLTIAISNLSDERL